MKFLNGGKMKPYDVFCQYIALKNHFTLEGYDYFRYGGKTNAREDTFETRRDKYFFMRLAKKDEPFEYMLSNFVKRGSKTWIGDILDSSGEENYLNWKKRKESLTYSFKSDLSKLKDDLDDNLIVEGGEKPYLLRLYLLGDFSIESLCVLNACLNFVPYWDKEISEYDPMWQETKLLMKKYTPFMSFDKELMKAVIHERFD